MYDPQLAGQQVHDFNPGITQNGVFWTTVVSDSDVQVDLGAGRATLQVDDIAQKDPASAVRGQMSGSFWGCELG